MASTILINTCFGGSDATPGTDDSDVTSGTLWFQFADNNSSPGDDDRIAVPPSGTNYSFWKHTYFRMSARPGAEVVNNLKFYSDGANGFGTGVGLVVSDQLPAHTAAADTEYEVDNHTEGLTSDDMDAGSNNHSICTTVSDVFGLTAGAALAVTIGEASTQMDAVAEVSAFVLLQMTVASTASAGALAAETLTYRYDEA